MKIMEFYGLNPELIKENLNNLYKGLTKRKCFDEIPVKVKTALTRKFNQKFKSMNKKGSNKNSNEDKIKESENDDSEGIIEEEELES